MIKSFCAAAAVLAGAGLVAAAPASASASAANHPGGSAAAGYVARPSALHKAAVTITVPTVTCGHASGSRTVLLGLFATARTTNSHARPVGLFVRAVCTGGKTTYTAEYHGGGTAVVHVHRGNRVRLILQGASGFEIDDNTTGTGSGGGSSSTATLNRGVLIGAETGRRAPSRQVLAMFHNPHVNAEALAEVGHHRIGPGKHAQVSTLKHGDFDIALG